MAKLKFSYQKVVKDRLNQKRREHPPSYYLKANLAAIVRNCKWDHQDWVFMVTGMEGAGKSNLAISIAAEMDPTFNIKEGMIKSLLDYTNFLEKYRNTPYKAIVLDEAISILFSRQHASKENVEFVKFMSLNRKYKHFIIFVIPNPFSLDIEIRQRRFKSMLYVFHNRKTRIRKYAFYSQRKIMMHMNDDMRKFFGSPSLFMKFAPPLYVEAFDKMSKKLRKQYDNEKDDHLENEFQKLKMIALKIEKKKNK